MLLEAAGWHVCDAAAANIHAARGVAIREFPLPGYGFADYLLYVDGKAAGVVEANLGIEPDDFEFAPFVQSRKADWARCISYSATN